MNKHGMCAWMMVAVVGMGVAGSALAQPGPGSGSGDPLRGPDVKERRAPRGEGDFGGGGPGFKNRKGEGDAHGRMRAYLDAFGAVLGKDAPESVRATDEQRAQVQGIFREFGAKARAYMEQHREEMKGLRSGAGDDNAKQVNRQKLEDIAAGAPKPKDAYNQAWALLNPAQQEAVKARLAKVEERMAQQREDAYVKRHAGRGKGGQGAAREPGGAQGAPGDGKRPGRLDKRPDGPGPRGPGGPRGEGSPLERGGPDARRGPGGPGGPDGPRGFGPGGLGPGGPGGELARRPMPPEVRERLMNAFSRMSPEQQEQVLRRLEERAGPGGEPGRPGPGRPGRTGARERGEPKGPPPMDDVNVPQTPAPSDPKAGGDMES